MSFYNYYKTDGSPLTNIKVKIEVMKTPACEDSEFGTGAFSFQLNACSGVMMYQNCLFSIPWASSGMSWGPEIWQGGNMVQARNGNIDLPPPAIQAFMSGQAIMTLGIDTVNGVMTILVVQDNQILFESVWPFILGPLNEFHFVIVGASNGSVATFTDGIFKVTVQADQKDLNVRPRNATISGCYFLEAGCCEGTLETSNLIEFIPRFPCWPIMFYTGLNLGELICLAWIQK